MNCANHPDQDAPYQCFRCRKPICVDCETKLDGNSICRSCLADLREEVAARYQAESRSINYGGALLAGVVAALAGAFAWSQVPVMTNGYRLEAGAAGVGALVGYAVMAGAGGKRHLQLQRMASVLALLGILAAYVLMLVRTGAAARLGADAFESPAISALYALPAYLSQLNFLDWVFAVVGVVLAFYIPHVRTLGDRGW